MMKSASICHDMLAEVSLPGGGRSISAALAAAHLAVTEEPGLTVIFVTDAHKLLCGVASHPPRKHVVIALSDAAPRPFTPPEVLRDALLCCARNLP